MTDSGVQHAKSLQGQQVIAMSGVPKKSRERRQAARKRAAAKDYVTGLLEAAVFRSMS